MSNRSNPKLEVPATSLELSPEIINGYIAQAHQMRSEELGKALQRLISAPRRLVEHILASHRKTPGKTAFS